MPKRYQISCPKCNKSFQLPIAIRNQITEDIRDQIEVDTRVQLRARDEIIRRLAALAEGIQKKARQTSGEGTAFEDHLEEDLRIQFGAKDQIERIPRGKKGADILQHIKTDNAQYCGTIVWEAKHTTSWLGSWVGTLKRNVAEVGGDSIGIIVTRVLPSGIKHFGIHRGVLVTSFECVPGLAWIIRSKFAELHHARLISEARETIQDLVFDYLIGQDFTRLIIASDEALSEMQSDLDQERLALTKKLARRQGQLQRLAMGLAAMCGHLEGMGVPLQKVPRFELESITMESNLLAE
jgi:hypothetical protein